MLIQRFLNYGREFRHKSRVLPGWEELEKQEAKMCVCVLVTQLCLMLSDPMNCSPPGSSVHGILQAGILEWVAMLSSSGSSQPRDQTWVFCIAGRFFTI